jgi:hypothetical protein
VVTFAELGARSNLALPHFPCCGSLFRGRASAWGVFFSPEVWFLSKRLLPLIPAGLVVHQILPSPEHLTIVVAPRELCAACPACAKPSWRARLTAAMGRTLRFCRDYRSAGCQRRCLCTA